MDVATSTKKVAVVKQKIRALRDNVDSSQNMVSGQPLNGNKKQCASRKSRGVLQKIDHSGGSRGATGANAPPSKTAKD